ncbi:MAG: hypothetical protein C0398_07560 [Coprothermobacter sp.]|nr:hypothetical protein [Coprothermobacter sp.]
MFRATPYTPEFEGDLKHLKKRYPSLDEDLTVLAKALYVWLRVLGKAGQSYDDGYVIMSNYGTNGCHLYKVKHMACAAIPGKGSRTGLRVICAYWPASDTPDFMRFLRWAQSLIGEQLPYWKNLCAEIVSGTVN